MAAGQGREDGFNIGAPARARGQPGPALGSQCHVVHPALGIAPHLVIRAGNEFREDCSTPSGNGVGWNEPGISHPTPARTGSV